MSISRLDFRPWVAEAGNLRVEVDFLKDIGASLFALVRTEVKGGFCMDGCNCSFDSRVVKP
jgi:hypothetical protein